MRILVITSVTPLVQGDAEILAGRLCQAFNDAGHAAELICVPFKQYPPNCIVDHMLACRLLDVTEASGVRVDRVIALNFPAYLIPHPSKVIWLVNQHRTAYELWDDPTAGDLIHCSDGPVIREAIRQADLEMLPEAKALFTLSEKVADRMQRSCGIRGEPLYHPPLDADVFHAGSDGGYFFLPNRGGVQRQLLVIEALANSRERALIRWAGEVADPGELAMCKESIRQFKVEDRIEWLGDISGEQRRDLYANCLGVIDPSIDQDYPYGTLAAMLCAKPVITCADSGGPLEFVIDRQTGLVAGHTPESLACAMDTLLTDRRYAKVLGQAGRAWYQDRKISWPHVIEKLLC